MTQEFATSQDKIIAVMGPTGVGKSTLIEAATGQDGRTIGHRLKSFTSEIRAVRTQNPIDGSSVVFVDTPGFDDTYKSDTEVLSMIAEWLVKAYRGKVMLTGLLYLHRISDNRMFGSTLTNLGVFKSLCGERNMQNVILVTTMWGQVKPEVGEQREGELKKEFWSSMLAMGSRTMRFQDTYRSAWDIADSVVTSRNSVDSAQNITKKLRLLSGAREVDRVIGIVGPRGAGKSSFIELATGRKDGAMKHSVQLSTIETTHPKDGRRVVFIDTPGFNDSSRTEAQVLSMTTAWLTKNYGKKVKLAGLLYLHQVSDNQKLALRPTTIKLFGKLCGKNAMQNVILVTTKWNRGTGGEDARVRREEELKRDWKPMLDLGSRMMRFENTRESAWSIIDSILWSLQIQEEIVDIHMGLNETAAARTLQEALKKLLEDQKAATRRLQEQAAKQVHNEVLVHKLHERKKEIERKIRSTKRQIKLLSTSWMRRVFTAR